MKKPVLIASASFDQHAYGPVSRLLEKKGYSVIVYKTDKLLLSEDRFTIDLSKGMPTIDYNGVSILPENLSAAWYRKKASFGLPNADTQLAKQLYMNNEVRALHDTIWPQLYPENIWLSSPAKIIRADRKLGQLQLAHEIGFNVPETVVSSHWGFIGATLLSRDDAQIIVKMMRGVISDDNQIKALPTTVLDHQRVDDLRGCTAPFPGIYQPYVEKAREWRVTVVGDDVFPVAIYTDKGAKDDWRKHQNTDAVQFKRARLPGSIVDKCILYLQRMGRIAKQRE